MAASSSSHSASQKFNASLKSSTMTKNSNRYRGQPKTGESQKTQIQKKNIHKGYESLGSDAAGVIYTPPPPNQQTLPGRHNLKYTLISSNQNSKNSDSKEDNLPLFFKTPPGVMVGASVRGIGRPNPTKDNAATRKFTTIMLFGIIDQDGTIDPYPIFSKRICDLWLKRNPANRENPDERTFKFELTNFNNQFKKALDQIVHFFVHADYLFDVTKEVGKKIIGEKIICRDKLASDQRQKYVDNKRSGMSDSENIPDYEVKEWSKLFEQDPDMDSVFLEEAIYNTMKNPISQSATTISEDQFRVVLINSFLDDLWDECGGDQKGVYEKILPMAEEKAKQYIETHPDWAENLFAIRFNRRVFKPPAKRSMKDVENDKDICHSFYTQLVNKIEKQFPNKTEKELNDLVTINFIIYMVETMGYTYNGPEVYTPTGEKAIDPNIKKSNNHDFWLKQHECFNAGSICSLQFMLDISYPLQNAHYGVKSLMIGGVESQFIAKYTQSYSFKPELSGFGETAQGRSSIQMINSEIKNKSSNDDDENQSVDPSSSNGDFISPLLEAPDTIGNEKVHDDMKDEYGKHSDNEDDNSDKNGSRKRSSYSGFNELDEEKSSKKKK